MRRLRLSALTLVAAFAAVAVAQADVYEIKRLLRDDIGRVAPRTDVPIRVPVRMNLDYDGRLFGGGSGSKRRYDLTLDATETCGANVCMLASFSGERGGEPAFRRKVALAKGITGYYKPLTCGGSCSPPTIQWKQRRVLYSIQAKLGLSGRAKQRRAMVRAANSAIRARPR